MLTKEQINSYCASLSWHLPSSEIKDKLTEINKQAQQAIDLAYENERLKAKLDAVRKWASNPVRIDDFGYQMAQESVLAIIGKDGDE